MRNNKQDLLTIIRIDMNLLWYDDEKMMELYGMTYNQISKLSYEEVKKIKTNLHNRYIEIEKQRAWLNSQSYNQ